MSTLFRLAVIAAAMTTSIGFAMAQQPGAKAAPPPSHAPAAAEPAQIFSETHLAVARNVAIASGITRSLDLVPPQFFDRVRQQALARPDLVKDLGIVLAGLEPEMDLQKQQMINVIARIFAARMSEAELNDVMAFFSSPSGRKYVESQPQVLDDLVKEMHAWTQELAEYVMVRVRAEMSKRGHQMQ